MSVRDRHREVIKIVVIKCECGHRYEEHNQFGCCNNDDVCWCLKSRAELENKNEENS